MEVLMEALTPPPPNSSIKRTGFQVLVTWFYKLAQTQPLVQPLDKQTKKKEYLLKELEATSQPLECDLVHIA